MIPKFTLRAQRGLDLPIHGDGLSVRSYLYVEDVADAYITVLLKGKVRYTAGIGLRPTGAWSDINGICWQEQQRHARRSPSNECTHPPQVGETYNIGTQKERTVVDVARDICKLFNMPESKIVHVRDRAFNDRR